MGSGCVIEGSNGEGRDLGSGFVCLFDTTGFFLGESCLFFCLPLGLIKLDESFFFLDFAE